MFGAFYFPLIPEIFVLALSATAFNIFKRCGDSINFFSDVGDSAKKYKLVIFAGLNHQNFAFFGLVPKSPIHTGLICVKKEPGAEYLKLGPL
jgi:hypothetical protein